MCMSDTIFFLVKTVKTKVKEERVCEAKSRILSKMIGEIVVFFSFLVENCVSVFTVRSYSNNTTEEDPLIQQEDLLQDFARFDEGDQVFQEYDPPEDYVDDPKGWKHSLPTWYVSIKDAVKNVAMIQTLSGSIIGILVVGIVILDFTFAEWCYNLTDHWNELPKKVQNLRVTAQVIEGALIQMWDFCCIAAVFPLSLIKDLHLLTFNVLAAFIDVTYRLYLQMVGLYGVSWKSLPLNGLFAFVILTNNYLLARAFHPTSIKNTLKLDFMLSAQFILGLPAALILVYGLFPWYIDQNDHIKVVIASLSPLLTALPKVIARIGGQTLHAIIHPGKGFVLVSCLYASSAVVFRIMQSDITNLGLFTALGIAHGFIDLIERITVTMRDQIWDYLYRYILRRQKPPKKYVTLRSRRFTADLTIDIMLQEATCLVASLGFMTVYQILFVNEKPYVNMAIIKDFLFRVIIGLSIDLVFNSLALLLQMRYMNIAVGRVWRKKWCYHIIVNTMILSLSVIYFSEYLFKVVKDKYGDIHLTQNCTYPDFL